MKLSKLKARLESKAALMSCVRYDEMLASVDFDAIAMTEKSENYAMPCWGEPALSVNDGTATIKIRGLLVPGLGADLSSWGITGYDVITHYLDVANIDDNVEQIVLDIDSGGGYVKGVFETARTIANNKKPIHSFVSGDMYSAAYWLGCSANTVTTKTMAGLGSIGVYCEHYDRSKYLEEKGVKNRVFKSGFWKGAFSSERPLSDVEAERLQSDIEKTAQIFFEHVAVMRNMTSEAVAKLDGDTFDTNKALELGLIDNIDNQGVYTMTTQKAEIEQSIATARQEAKAEAFAEFQAQAKADAERIKTIYQACGNSALKDLLATDDFASVPTESLLAVLTTAPKGFTETMNDEGGAGVEVSPTDFAEKTDAEIEANAKAKAQASAVEKLKTLGKGI